MILIFYSSYGMKDINEEFLINDVYVFLVSCINYLYLRTRNHFVFFMFSVGKGKQSQIWYLRVTNGPIQ